MPGPNDPVIEPGPPDPYPRNPDGSIDYRNPDGGFLPNRPGHVGNPDLPWMAEIEAEELEKAKAEGKAEEVPPFVPPENGG